MYRGYIKIYRKAEENPLYFSEVFTKWHAWSDLILIANHKEKTLSVRGNLIKINRGQIAHSEASLASRWKWSRGKVRRFINYLKTAQQIEQQQSSILNILTIKNYDIYHGNGTADSTTDGQQTVQQTDTNNNDKNVKNDKKIERLKKFIPPTIEDVTKYIQDNKYHVNAIDFFKYFSEGKWIDSKGNPVRNWKQKIITWENHLDAEQKQAIVIKTACAKCNTAFDYRETTYEHDGKKICGKCDMKLTRERLNLKKGEFEKWT